MKITESQLRKIIREELKAVREVDDSDERATMRKMRDDRRALDSALSAEVEAKYNSLTPLEIIPMINNLKNGPKRGTYYDELNLVRDGKKSAADAAKELLPLIQVTMEEEKTDPIPLRTIFTDAEVEAAIADREGRSRRAKRQIPDPTPQIIRTRLNTMLGQKTGEGIASYQGTSASPKRKLMIRTAIRAYENDYTRRKRR